MLHICIVSNLFKWLAGGLGWAFGGPIGGILGFAVGKVLSDLANAGSDDLGPIEKSEMPVHTKPGDYEVSLLVLAAVVIKADGKTNQQELDFVRQYFARLYGAKHANDSFKLFKEIVIQNISIHQVCAQIRSHINHPGRLQLLHFLFSIAKSDGHVTSAEVEAIQKIAGYLYINEKDFLSIRSMFYAGNHHYYEILELSPEVSDEEVKKAYRRMAMKYHPDRLEGLGSEVKQAAQEKFIKVKQAYEAILAERGTKSN